MLEVMDRIEGALRTGVTEYDLEYAIATGISTSASPAGTLMVGHGNDHYRVYVCKEDLTAYTAEQVYEAVAQQMHRHELSPWLWCGGVIGSVTHCTKCDGLMSLSELNGFVPRGTLHDEPCDRA